MSTTVPSSPAPRGGRARDTRGSQRPRSARALRVRNACIRHAADRLGLRVPDDAELSRLSPDTTLTEAVQLLEPRKNSMSVEAGLPLLLKAAWVTAITLIGLAFSYGRVQ